MPAEAYMLQSGVEDGDWIKAAVAELAWQADTTEMGSLNQTEGQFSIEIAALRQSCGARTGQDCGDSFMRTTGQQKKSSQIRDDGAIPIP